ncbi:HAMP domain-containing sensor histidine kinase [Paenibacillus donghaensis]|uniref:histidine kinase n=1 Tax=Paenibacillus donghaensis TaxID=414771 RepID=A0A2Z2KGA8_9BACL|nr:HAMP domain-containing sensor histidine kinase [Paenibacillus donghaensis]ASA24867.1 two-component sensor histidine kinase [Paenibacillus donghaensis]
MKLSTKYLLIIVMSIFIFPISFLGVNFLYYFTLTKLVIHPQQIYYEPNELKAEWMQVIDSLGGRSDSEIISGLTQAMKYKDSTVSWIGDNGEVLMSEPKSNKLQTPWSVSDVFTLANREKNNELYTVSLLLKGQQTEGFVILEIPEQLMGSQWETVRGKYSYLWFGSLVIIWMLFVSISWFFFSQLQKRLVAMQENMDREWEGGIPETVIVEKEDEIGQLQLSFNRMVEQLKVSRAKEQHEMELRKNLIANLSHDLRTPLTIIRGHAFRIDKERLPEEDRNSLKIIYDKVDFLGELIEDLSSLTLLNAGKLPMNKTITDIRKIVRASMSGWYPIFEQKGFVVEVELEHSIVWDVDEIWLKRILDNLFQNIIRHAAIGKYISVRSLQTSESSVAFVIKDRGPGLQSTSEHKGIGIGLTIVTIMLQQMGLEQIWESSGEGTSLSIYPQNPV